MTIDSIIDRIDAKMTRYSTVAKCAAVAGIITAGLLYGNALYENNPKKANSSGIIVVSSMVLGAAYGRIKYGKDKEAQYDPVRP